MHRQMFMRLAHFLQPHTNTGRELQEAGWRWKCSQKQADLWFLSFDEVFFSFYLCFTSKSPLHDHARLFVLTFFYRSIFFAMMPSRVMES